jgi:hypothetical protein
MKKTLYFLVLSFVFVSCKQTITNQDISKINGYWEIEKVLLKDGEKKDYKINETVDYFQVANNKGWRKKVMPQLDGTYRTNNVQEDISISSEGGNFYINYSTSYGKWQEEIIEIKDSTLVLKNKEEQEYYYKKYQGFSLK